MKRLRHVVALAAIVGLVISITLLLNFTAPNPTGRRYSSRMPLQPGQGTPNEIGEDAERVLSEDLGLPRNDDSSGECRCICNSAGATAPPGRCNTCFVVLETTSSYRVPDFVGPDFIAESKNTARLLGDYRDYPQIDDLAKAATALKWPLWIYVRVDTQVDPDYARVAAATGGGIVYYFTVPGYVDPIDFLATVVLLISLAVLGWAGLRELAANRHFHLPTAPGRSTNKKRGRPDRTLEKAIRNTDDLEAFKEKSKDTSRRKIDEEDARDEFR
jgi:hypothetical protein